MTDRKTTLWVVIGLVIAIVAIVLIAAAFFAPSANFEFDGHHMNIGENWVWWMALMMIVGVLIVVLIVIAFLYALRPSAPSGPYYPPPSPPAYDQSAERKREALEVLGQRYARGEITTEEYLRMKDDMR